MQEITLKTNYYMLSFSTCWKDNSPYGNYSVETLFFPLFYLSFLCCVMVWVTCPQLYTITFLDKLWPTHNVIVPLLPTGDHLDQEESDNLTPCFSDSWGCRWDNQVLQLPNAEKVPREVWSGFLLHKHSFLCEDKHYYHPEVLKRWSFISRSDDS